MAERTVIGLRARCYHSRNRRTMSRFERLLIPIIALVMIAAFLLEGMGPAGVRRIALGLGILLLAAIVVGNLVRAAQAGTLAPRALRIRRKEVVRNDPAQPAVPGSFESPTPRGR